MNLSKFLHDIMLANKKFDLNFDSFSIGQLQSKEWVVEIMKDVRMVKKIEYGTIFNLCGWYGILSAMLWVKDVPFSTIRSFDIDESCLEIADQINKTNSGDNWRFKAITKDIFNINFEGDTWQVWSNANNRMCHPITDVPDTIINTSCEHTNPSWFQNIPRGKIVILQSNDFLEGDGHVNCMTDLDEFKEVYPLTETWYDGSMKFPKYKRFMLIGVK